jgi:hypothetical protein
MELPDALVGRSTLTEKQLESLKSYRNVAKGELLLREAASLRSGKPVTAGSYWGTVQQGREKMRESMVTVLIGIWLGLIKLEDVRRLFDLVGRGETELSDDDVGRLSQVLETLVGRIVM